MIHPIPRPVSGCLCRQALRHSPWGESRPVLHGVDDKNVLFDGKGRGREQRETMGARIWGSKRPLGLNNEFHISMGKLSIPMIFVHGPLRRKLGIASNRSSSVPGSAYARNAFSGNQNPASRTVGTFNSLYQTGPYFSYAELFGNRNLGVLQRVWPSVSPRT